MNPRAAGTSPPYISTRKYIKWGDKPAGEKTSTLVLTTPKKHYSDVRIYLPLPSPSPTPPQLPISQLEWAFAGTSTATPSTPSKPQHTIWTHWVDSNHPLGTEVQDEGDMYPQENGDTLEFGNMVNPESGVVEGYEECWVDWDLDSDSGGDGDGEVVNGERAKGGKGDRDRGKRGWVVKCDREGCRGMVVRIGGWIQGVIKNGEEVGAERWEKNNGAGEWRNVVKVGQVRIGIEGLLEREESFKLGDVIDVDATGQSEIGGGSVTWTVIESFAWS